VPVCGYLKEFSVQPVSGGLAVSFQPVGASGEVFIEILRRTFAHSNLQLTRDPGFLSLLLPTQISLIGTEPSVEQLDGLFDLLQKCITVDDSLDESHCLSPHNLPPKEEGGTWSHTRLGGLLYEVKDYTRRRDVADRQAADKIATELESFVRKHPRYSATEYIVSAPSSSTRRGTDLPLYLGRRLAEKLGKRMLQAERITAIPEQKDRVNQEDSKSAIDAQERTIVVRQQLSGFRCILLDDLYESGGTMLELARACREVGAGEVLGLAVTKNARYTQGMRLEDWSWD